MPLYGCQPPTGYKDTADAWVNTGALVNRMNFALPLPAATLGDWIERGGVDDVPTAPAPNGDDDADRSSALARRSLDDDARDGRRSATDAAAGRSRSILGSPRIPEKVDRHDLPTRLSEERRPSRWSASASRRRSSRARRSPQARRAREAADRDLPARRRRRPEHGRARSASADYYRARPSIAIAAARRRRRGGARSRRLLRLPPALAAAEAALGRAASSPIVHACGSPDARARTSTRRTTWRPRRRA